MTEDEYIAATEAECVRAALRVLTGLIYEPNAEDMRVARRALTRMARRLEAALPDAEVAGEVEG